jgi:hypothetical protein
MKSASSSKVENMKKNFKTAAKKRNNQHCTRDFDQSIEESHILDLIGNNSVDKENYNKKFGIEEIFVDFESKILYLKLNFVFKFNISRTFTNLRISWTSTQISSTITHFLNIH